MHIRYSLPRSSKHVFFLGLGATVAVFRGMVVKWMETNSNLFSRTFVSPCPTWINRSYEELQFLRESKTIRRHNNVVCTMWIYQGLTTSLLTLWNVVIFRNYWLPAGLGARRFGFLAFPYERDCQVLGVSLEPLESQITGAQTTNQKYLSDVKILKSLGPKTRTKTDQCYNYKTN